MILSSPHFTSIQLQDPPFHIVKKDAFLVFDTTVSKTFLIPWSHCFSCLLFHLLLPCHSTPFSFDVLNIKQLKSLKIKERSTYKRRQ